MGEQSIQRNQYDTRDSLEISRLSSRLFLQACKREGWTAWQAMSKEDMYEHWDYRIIKTVSGKTYAPRIELKAQKRVQRSDPEVQDVWAWIELHGVRVNDKGWLFNSKANYICFERDNCFEFYYRLRLIKRVYELVNFNKYVNCAKEAMYILYSRKDRPDIITRIEFSRIEDLCRGRWNKLDKGE